MIEYKQEAYNLFSDLMDAIKVEVLQNLFRSARHMFEPEKALAAAAVKPGAGKASRRLPPPPRRRPPAETAGRSRWWRTTPSRSRRADAGPDADAGQARAAEGGSQ
ncbi:MAG: hypothetical protein R3F11_04440 [Verrucomicrobiales bacterium]